jgi:leucyl/phenylalanyl-tRNA--protein transferase
MQLHWIDEQRPLPPTHLALPPQSEAPGLLAAGGRLTVERLEEAYRRGIFPWYSVNQPVLWWSPDPRMVLQTRAFKVSRALRKTVKKFIADPSCEIRIDHGFDRVMQLCAETPRDGQHGTWIVPAMQQAYRIWHRAGRVHSVETWMNGELVGGLYAVAIGHMVFGESMFSLRTDASKIALSALVAFCRAHNVVAIDCQQNTRHLASLGAFEVPRDLFERMLALGLGGGEIREWAYHPSHWSHLEL